MQTVPAAHTYVSDNDPNIIANNFTFQFTKAKKGESMPGVHLIPFCWPNGEDWQLFGSRGLLNRAGKNITLYFLLDVPGCGKTQDLPSPATPKV